MSEDLHELGTQGTRSARDLVEGLRLREGGPGGRPRVAGVMIASADGRAAVGGRSVALGHPADRALLRELRSAADVVLVGMATLVAERYRTLLDPEQAARRVGQGLPEHPVIATISRRLDVDLAAALPLLAEPGRPVWVFTEMPEPDLPDLPDVAAALRIIPLASLTIPAVLDELAAAGLLGVSCEGGPGLLREVVAQDALDDLLLTVAPLLVAGDAPRMLAGDALGAPVALALAAVHRADDHVFLHYRLRPS